MFINLCIQFLYHKLICNLSHTLYFSYKIFYALAVIESFDNSPIINEGTVFWSTDRKYLGKVIKY